MKKECDPVFASVDKVLEIISKSKSLHILYILNFKNKALRFSELKTKVDSSSTTISRRLNELEKCGLVIRTPCEDSNNRMEYSLSKDAKSLSPIIQSLYDWVSKSQMHVQTIA